VEVVNNNVMAWVIEETPKSAIQALPEGVTRILSYACDQRKVICIIEEMNQYCFQVSMYYIFFVQVL
jgi:hypothetical protein